MADLGALRSRLIALRADTLTRLAEADGVEPGYLNLLAGTDAALRALDADAAAAPDDAVTAERAVLVDDGQTIRLALYTEAAQVAAVELSPRYVLALATQMIVAASRRWPA